MLRDEGLDRSVLYSQLYIMHLACFFKILRHTFKAYHKITLLLLSFES